VYALDVSQALLSPNQVTKSPLWPARPIAERAFIDIVATRDLSESPITSASVGTIMFFALSPLPLIAP
jgi:hypothetical protein